MQRTAQRQAPGGQPSSVPTGGPASENVEWLAECLSVALDVAPLLGDEERAQLTAIHPFATPYWLDSLVASSKSQPTQDTQLIAQLMQQLQAYHDREQRLVAALEAERAQTAAALQQVASAEHAAKRPPRSDQPRPVGRPRSDSPAESADSYYDADGFDEGAAARPNPPPPLALDRQQQQQRSGKGGGGRQSPSRQSPSRGADEGRRDEASNGGREQRIEQQPGTTWDDVAANELERSTEYEEDAPSFRSISEEIKALNSGLIAEPSTTKSVDNREPCKHCGRKFLPDRLSRHVRVCEDLKRGQEWRGTWKSPSAGSKNPLLLDSRNSVGSSFKL